MLLEDREKLVPFDFDLPNSSSVRFFQYCYSRGLNGADSWKYIESKYLATNNTASMFVIRSRYNSRFSKPLCLLPRFQDGAMYLQLRENCRHSALRDRNSLQELERLVI